MRIQHWLQAIVCGMLFFTATPVIAQYPYSANGGYYPPPGMPYGGGDVSQLYPANTPQNFYPYPAISPYGPSGGMSGGAAGIDQTYQQNGLWFRQFTNQRRDYHFSVEAIQVRFRNPGNALVGSEPQDINIYARTAPLGEPFPPGELILGAIPMTGIGFLEADPGVFPIPLVDLPLVNDTGKFPIRGVNILDDIDTGGILTRWGYTNEDGSGLNWNASWAFDGQTDFQMGSEYINGILIDEGVTAALDGLNLFTKRGAVPLDNGEPGPLDPLSGTGSTAKFDIMYRIEASTQMGQTNLSWYHTPLFRHDWMQIRPLWGLRYTYLDEHFGFRGVDSGYDYDIDDGTEDGSFRPEPGSIILLYPQFKAVLDSDVSSHLAGPELGFRFDLGEGDSFHIWGETIGGLMLNNETIRVRGNNIGDPLYDAQLLGLQLPLLAIPRMFTNPTDFSETDNHTHISPIFTQSINADIDFLDYVPVVNRLNIFEDAKLRFGYQYFLAGHIARPADSIVWRGFPLFPEAKAGYKNWYSHQFNIGVNWEF